MYKRQKVCNSNYAPNGVADYTVMLMLLSLRKYKPALWRAQVNDYSLAGLQGRELRNLTVGILGTGKIGAAVIKNCLLYTSRAHPHKRLRNKQGENAKGRAFKAAKK